MTFRLSLLIVGLLVRAAVAQPPPATGTAQQHLAAATAAFEKGDYEDALKELRIAYTLEQQPEILYAIGQVHVRMGNCADAVTFYERFLATSPPADKADKANEAIETCKKVLAEQKPPPPPPPPPSPPPSPPPTPVAAIDRPVWYSDWLADGLAGLGVVAAGASVALFASARADRDRADARTSYAPYDALVSRAQTKQRVGIGLAAGSVALVGGAVIRYLFHRDREGPDVAVTVPSRGAGGVVTWGTRF